MNSNFTFTVNGRSCTVTTEPERTLLDVLREELRLTAAKYGCGEGQCRACTVLMNGKSVPACLTTVAEAHHQQIMTLEGLSNDSQLHPMQQAFLEEGAFQCGYCTPGMILGAVALLKSKPNPTDAEILAHMQRHICRCGSYPRILSAIQRAAGRPNKPGPDQHSGA